MVKTANPLGTYSCARSLLEFHAFVRYVYVRLSLAMDDGVNDWKSRGQSFFATVFRAKFGTTDPKKQKVLEQAGLMKEQTKTENWIQSHYDFLCDYVHHNQSSQTVSTSSGSIGRVAKSSGGGKIILKEPTPIFTYQYPSDFHAGYAVEQTAVNAYRNMRGAFESLNQCPESAYSREEVLKYTDTLFGMPEIETEPGRNDPCPCGSGLKYKKCHGSSA